MASLKRDGIGSFRYTLLMPDSLPNSPSDSPPVTLRPAAPGDAGEAAPLIYAAGPALYDRLFGPTRADALAFFLPLFAGTDSLFSHENGTVAVRDGRVVGLALAVPAAGYHRGRAVPRLLLRRGPRFLLGLLPVAWALRRSTVSPPADSYYLGILAVAPDVRGEGIGGLLLSDVSRRAQAAGCACVCLHAELGNAGARRFYARAGFVVTHERETPGAVRWGISGFVGMRREV